ncbi:MAG: hypothetical protein WCS77_09540 [Elusimicrobiaceae bacterium]|jgi:hypothetical protein
MNKTLHTEQHVHGKNWAAQHGGYFSNPAKARPLVNALLARSAAVQPAVLADLGGGTGFILSLYRKGAAGKKTRLVNIDISLKQLEACRRPHIRCVNSHVGKLGRSDIMENCSGPLMLTMRSLLHYTGGRSRWAAFLRGARGLCEKGEYFIHQTACFDAKADATLMNTVYRLMRTEKRYPQTEDLIQLLEETGWEVLEVLPAPPIHFNGDEMRDRYGLSASDIEAVAEAVAKSGGRSAAVHPSHGFTGFLEYRIFVCRAAV